ncbi:hypothetical protein ACI65C_000964 [Semiaphis heraclei]
MGRGEHLGWALRKLDHVALSRKLDEGPPFLEEPASADDSAEVLNNYLVNACNSCMPRRGYGVRKRKAVHWWNNEIADLRLECIKNRHIYLRVVKRQGPDGSTAERIAFREARHALRTSIRGHTVPLLRKLRYLGLYLDSHLTFSGHFTTVSGKASQAALAIDGS